MANRDALATYLRENVAYWEDRLAQHPEDATEMADAVLAASKKREPVKPKEPMPDPTREELIELCDRGIVQQEHWHDRDSSGAQQQLGKARVLLLAGCDFKICGPDDEFTASDENTWWVEITFKGFNYFEMGEWSEDTFYIPTAARLKDRGGDWY